MGHALFVTPLVQTQLAAVLLQRLAQPQHIAVAEDGENAFYEFDGFAIHFQVLVIKKLHQRLRHCQSQLAHFRLPFSASVMQARSGTLF
ncbi:hypothetical protein BN136_1458 [Cronobacter universalis NCTC 9529]|nr:hypothetical protein BN136_1458 [Cronobacter universalis NCTC 9529]